MINKLSVPFGGVFGWLADLTVSRKTASASGGSSRTELMVESYYVAEPDEGRAMRAVRVHADAGRDAPLAARRALSRNEIDRLGLNPGQVKSANP